MADGGGTRWDGSREPAWILPAFLAATAVATVLFYREFVFSAGRALAGTDMLGQGYQLREFALEEIRAGRGLPLWNPYLNGGLPYLAILPGPLFYPSTLLYLLMPLHRAIGWTFILHTFLGGGFTYFAARCFGLGRTASTVSGTAFLLTGYVTSHLYGGHDGRMFAMALIPLAFGLLERGLRRGRASWFVALGLVIGCQMLTPHVQVTYFSSLALGLYLLFRVASRRATSGESRSSIIRPLLQFGLAGAVAATLSAVQILPTIGLLEHVVRGGTGESGYAFASSYSLPAQELTAFFLPDLIGSLPARYWGSNPIKLHTEYLGAVPLALSAVALVGAFGSSDRRRRRTIWFLCSASALGVAFSLGSATPVHRIAYHLVPMIDRFRAPAMMLSVVAFFVALLAGFGWQTAEEARRSDRALPWVWVWALAAPFLLFGATAALSPSGLSEFAYTAWYPAGWPRRPPPEFTGALRLGGMALAGVGSIALLTAWAVARDRVSRLVVVPLLLLCVIDLWRVDARYVETVDAARAFRADHAAAYMADNLTPGERVWQLEGTYGSNDLMLHDVPSIAGVLNFRLRWWERLVGGLGFENLARNPALWGLFDLRFLSVRSELGLPSLTLATEGEGKRVYEVSPNPPHAYFPAAVRAIGDTASALRAVLGTRRFQESAVVESASVRPAGAGSAELLWYRPGDLGFRVHAVRPGLLFLSEMYHPGWRAWIEDREVELLRTNVAFLGAVVPEGEHELRLRFASPAYRLGRVLSLVTLLGSILYLVWASLLRGRLRRAAAGPPGASSVAPERTAAGSPLDGSSGARGT